MPRPWYSSPDGKWARKKKKDHWVRRYVRGGSAQKLDWLVVEEITQLDMALWADLACVGLNADVKFLLLGDFRQLPAVLEFLAGRPISAPLEHGQLIRDLAGGRHELTENMRSDPGILHKVAAGRRGGVPHAEQAKARLKELYPSKPGWHACASKTRGGSLGLRAYSMTPGATLVVARSLSASSRWPHSACKVCTLPAKAACRAGTTWSSSQVPAVSPQPHSAHLPSCVSAAPGTSRFAFSSFRKLVRQAGQALAPSAAPRAPPAALGSCAPPQPQPADGHGALADGHELAPRLAQVLAPEQPRLHVRGVKAPPLLDGRQGLPRLAPVEHARRLLQHPLHGPVHVAVPVEGQEAHGAVLLERQVVAVHEVALRAQHAHGGVAPHAPWRRCRGASSRGAAWRQSRRTLPKWILFYLTGS